MSFATCKMLHWPTGIENCASGFLTHRRSDFIPQMSSLQPEDAESEWPMRSRPGALPNLIVTAGNVLEVYVIRFQEGTTGDSLSLGDEKPNTVMDGISGASLELVCHYRLYGNVESMAILSMEGGDASRRRDSIVLSFKDAKISVLEYNESLHELRTSSMHCFEGSDWLHLKRGRESFVRGPLVRTDPQGRCCGVLIYDLQMIILNADQVGFGLIGDDDPYNVRGATSARIKSSHITNLRDLAIMHVKDFVFLYGYIEPVMVVLHEPELTWSGRMSSKYHTCIISALSISITLKQPIIIWAVANLPHDSFKLLAVPSPAGGVIVIGSNTIHYHSESSSCILALNQYAVPFDSSQVFPRANFSVELDTASATSLLNDVVLLSTKTGELLLLTLIYNGRVVQRIDLSKSKASVLASGITRIGCSLFFLASRLGDSLLVQFTDDLGSSFSRKEEFGNVDGGEELSLWASAPNNMESSQKTFSFIVRDSLINIGPLKDFSRGINADANTKGVSKQSNYELVCCSGHGKNGALSVLRQSIRPEMITEVELPGCRGIWTVYHKNACGRTVDSSSMSKDVEEFHAYLIISLETSTMVLETADLLAEVTESVDYYVQGRTIAVGNLFGRRRVIQVFEHGARILDGSFLTQELNFENPDADSGSNSMSSRVLSVSISDPYVLVRMVDGGIQLFVGDHSNCTVSVTTPPAFVNIKKPLAACTLYHDRAPEFWLRKANADAWLSTGVNDGLNGADGGPPDQGDTYCIVCYDSGDLEIFDVPSFGSVFSVDSFVAGKSHLVDTLVRDSHDDQDSEREEPSGRNLTVVELSMERWSGPHSRPFLCGLLSDGTFLCYHAYLFEGSDSSSRPDVSVSAGNSAMLSNGAARLRYLRFVRVFFDCFARDAVPSEASLKRINIFHDINGSEGYFLSGSRPAWFMVFRERVRAHPQLGDGAILAFSVLHNVNCSHGFIYVTSQGNLKICQLPSVCYDSHWPVQKIPLKGTPHQVTYNTELNLYLVLVSFPVNKPMNQVISSLMDHEASHPHENSNSSSDEVQQTYTIDEFEVRIMEPDRSGFPWQMKATIQMHSIENALTLRMLTLNNTTTKENDTLLAVGTAYLQGEDVASRGRVILFSIAKDDNAQISASEVYSKESKGAVSALASLQGLLLIACGPKIVLHRWTGVELNVVAFYDVPPLFVVSMNIVKNFILIGDVHKSIHFLSWKEQGSQLNPLAKDFGSLDCLATEFLIDGTSLSLVVSDEQKNIQIFYYAPKMAESWKGQKLLSRGEFHLGAHVPKFMRLQMLSSSTEQSEKVNRFALLFGTLDGGIGCIAPLDELTFRRLMSLQNKLVDAIPHVAGLNPRSFRHFCSQGRPHRPGPENIVDCELLLRYEMLPLEKQHEIAHQCGTVRDHILSNLDDLHVATSFF